MEEAQQNAHKSMLVHDCENEGREKHVGEIEGKQMNEGEIEKKMHGAKIEGKEMNGKENRGQGNQGQGLTPPPPPTPGQRRGQRVKGQMSLCRMPRGEG